MENISIYFDYLGILFWVFVLYIFWTDSRNQQIKKDVFRWLVFVIGIGGLLLDGSLVFSFIFGNPFANNAARFDFLGIPVFLFLMFLSAGDLKSERYDRKFEKVLLLFFSVCGFLIDSFALWANFSK